MGQKIKKQQTEMVFRVSVNPQKSIHEDNLNFTVLLYPPFFN